MKTIIHNQTRNKIRLAIVAVCMVLLMGSSLAIAEEPLMLASLTRNTPLEDIENYDRFPGYHKEAREMENKKEIKVEIDVLEEIEKAEHKDAVDTIVSSTEWVGNKAVDSYMILNGDYPRLFMGLFSD